MDEIKEQLEYEEGLISLKEIHEIEKELNPMIMKDKFSLGKLL